MLGRNSLRLSTASRRTRFPVQASPPVRAGFALGSLPRWALWLVVFSSAAAGFSAAPLSHGQDIDREYKLKAVYLYKFATYVKWPKRTFEDASSPFVIGILGPDPVGPDLRRIAKVKKIDGRRIEVRNYRQADKIRDCHILFMSRALKNETQQATIKLLSKRNILFVGETPDFLKHGGVCDFVIHENRVLVYISKSAYESENLEISAQLLRIATVLK